MYWIRWQGVGYSTMEVTREISGQWVGDDEFKLSEPVAFKGKLKGGEDIEVVVPAGFITDFASVPRVFWTIIPRDGLVSNAAIVHDFLYRTHVVDRKSADWIMFGIMKVMGVASWKRWVIHRALRAFGGFAWRAQGKAREQGATVEEIVRRAPMRRKGKPPHK